ncbi:6794_t:CDS:2 [Cetraspora pellucida]|uniref:6794_t:CDS:1 n=1 Tax=Cetraspora pellucida TaxID=1433469 RepID=A0A9N9NN70_9GLOM|nr:6794_t:CDS:2 [Cetraspora pellucida]
MQKIETALNLFVADHSSIHLLYLTDNEQSKLEDVLALLEPLEAATKLLLATSYPTMGDILLDPCTKLKIFDIADAVNAKKAIQEAINQYVHGDRHTLLTSDDAFESLIKTARKFFWNLHNQSEIEEPNYTVENTSRQELSAMDTNELDNYLTFDTVEEDTDPLDWWKTN